MTAEMIFGDVPPLEVAFTDKRGDQENLCHVHSARRSGKKGLKDSALHRGHPHRRSTLTISPSSGQQRYRDYRQPEHW